MKLRKFLAVSMVTVLTTASLAACGSDDEENSSKKESKINSFKASIEEGAKMENFEYSADMSIKATGEALDEETKEMFGLKGDTVEMSVYFNGEQAGDNMSSTIGLNIGEFKSDFIEVMYVDGNAFFNLEMLSDGAKKLASELADTDITEQIKEVMPEGKYLKITKEQLNSIFEEAIGMDVDTYMEMLQSSVDTEENKKAVEIFEYFVDLLDKAAKNANLYKNDGDKYTLTINSDNLNEITKALCEVVEKESEEIAKKLNDFCGEETITAQDLKATVAMLKVYDLEEMIGDELDFSISISTEYTEEKWAVGFSFGIEVEGDSIEIGLSFEAVEKDDLKITAPTDLVEEEAADELIEAIISGIGSSVNSESSMEIYQDFNDLEDINEFDDYDDLEDLYDFEF